MNDVLDVLIIGGGVIGLTSAIAMAERGFSVSLVDSGSLSADQPENSRVYAINSASRRLLETLGVWEGIASTVKTPYTKMHIWDAASKASMDFHARMKAQSALGFIVEEFGLLQVLIERAKALNVSCHSFSTVISCVEQTDFMQIKTNEGGCYCAKLLMVADGARSKTRDLLSVPLTSWSYQHDALVATVEVEKQHQNTAYQVFHPDGPLAFLPLHDPNLCSIVWSHPPARIKTLAALDESAFNGALERAFESKLGTTKVLSKRVSFPLHMRHVRQYTGARWLLLGDAAHTIHPLAGLGLNVGLADLSSWIRLLDEGKTCTWSSRKLKAYQRERKHAVWSVIALMQLIKTTFGLSVSPLANFRGQGMRLINQLEPLKRGFIQIASGD